VLRLEFDRVGEFDETSEGETGEEVEELRYVVRVVVEEFFEFA